MPKTRNKTPLQSLSFSDDHNKKAADERQLVARSVEGESSAFGLLYDQYLPRMYRFVFFKVGHREEAEDLTHQIFLSAWENIHSFQEQGLPITSWLYKIARNRIIDHYRTKKIHTPLEEMPHEFIQATNGLEDADERMQAEKIYTSLHHLPDDQQEVITLRFIEELTPKETAHVMEKSEVAIRVLQHRAIKNLKNIIET